MIVVTMGNAKAMMKYREREFFFSSRSFIGLYFAVDQGAGQDYKWYARKCGAVWMRSPGGYFFVRLWPITDLAIMFPSRWIEG